FISQDRLNTMSLVEKEARHQYFEEFSSVLGTLMESKSKEARDLGFSAFGKRTTPEQLEILSKFSPDRQITFFRRQFSEPASQTKAHAANLMGALPLKQINDILPKLSSDSNPAISQSAILSQIKHKILSKDPMQIQSAEQQLRIQNETDQVAILRELLLESDRQPFIRHKPPFVIKYLSTAENSKVEKSLASLLSDPEPSIRSGAMRAITEIPIEHQASIIKAIAVRIPADHRKYLEIALSQVQSQEEGGTAKTPKQLEAMSSDQRKSYFVARQKHINLYTEVIEKLINSKTKEARETGYGAVGSRTAADQLDIIGELFSKPDKPSNRKHAAFLLRQVGFPSEHNQALTEFYKRAFNDSDADVRKAGIESLVEIIQSSERSNSLTELIPLINNLSSDTNETVTQAASRALSKLKAKQRDSVNLTIKEWTLTQRAKKVSGHLNQPSIRSPDFFNKSDSLEESVGKFNEAVKELHKPLHTRPCSP
ncbi:MAG: HEAT repeat domain-containing protein, partial [Bdellovibrionia bacterium]